MEDEPLYQCLLWLNDAWLICTQIKHVCLNTVPLIKATFGLWFIVWTGFYTSGKLNKCNLAEFLSVNTKITLPYSARVFWFIVQCFGSLLTQVTFENGLFHLQWRKLCWHGLPYSEVFYLCLPTMPQAQHGWRLTDGRHKFPTSKTEHFAACLPQHKGTFMQAKRSAEH